MKENAIALAAASVLALSMQAALAQDKPAPPPIWKQGQPESMKDSKLAPNPGKMTETAGERDSARQAQAAEGLQGRGLGHRHGRRARDGVRRRPGKKIYVGTRGIGRVYEVTDDGDKRTVRVVVDKLTQPLGRRLPDGSLYVMRDRQGAALRRHRRAIADVAPVDMTAAFNLPPEQHHNWKYVRFGPDKKLYVPFGAPCNICEPPTQGIRADPPLQRGRLRHGSDRHRHPQHAGLRLASEDGRALVHRPRPRLAGRQRAGGRAQPHGQGRAELTASRTATPRASSTRTSPKARRTPARALRCR